MKLSKLAAAAIVIAWLALWATNTGLLVYSSDTGVLGTRGCGYLIGVTVMKRVEPFAKRCPLLRQFGT